MKYFIALSFLFASILSVGQNTFPASGNVGIGTTTPDGFQINAALNQETTRGVNNIRFGVMGGTPRMIFDSGGNTPFEIDNASGQLRFFTPGVVKMVINSNGNIGIGTTNPSSKLHVDGGHVYLGPLAGTNSGVGRLSVSGVTAEISLSNRAISSFVEDPSLGERWVIYNDGTATDGKLRFWSGGDKAVITKEGNVGIGTTSPDALLAVAGQVHAQEVKVSITVPGPDYVFASDYKLTSLEEIKNYIDQNKHLPEIPSAKEMEKNGVQLGEMNMLLLKKIEELTLYVIELKKDNNELKDQAKGISELKAEIKSIKKQLKH